VPYCTRARNYFIRNINVSALSKQALSTSLLIRIIRIFPVKVGYGSQTTCASDGVSGAPPKEPYKAKYYSIYLRVYLRRYIAASITLPLLYGILIRMPTRIWLVPIISVYYNDLFFAVTVRFSIKRYPLEAWHRYRPTTQVCACILKKKIVY